MLVYYQFNTCSALYRHPLSQSYKYSEAFENNSNSERYINAVKHLKTAVTMKGV